MAVLRSVRGVGRRKLAQFGEELLEIIRLHAGEPGEPREEVSVSAIKKPKPEASVKKPAYWHSAELARNGMQITEIAEKRGFTVRTIESHITEAIRLGELDVFQFISREKFDRIKEIFDRTRSRLKKPVKEELGEEVSYGELGFVLAYLDNSNQNASGSDEENNGIREG
jgi:uncharacterized protein YpbB